MGAVVLFTITINWRTHLFTENEELQFRSSSKMSEEYNMRDCIPKDSGIY